MTLSHSGAIVSRRLTSAFTVISGLLLGACATERAAAPTLPGNTPTAQFRPLAFTADVDMRTGKITIVAPNASTANGPTLSLGGEERPNLSLLGGEAVRLIPSNYVADPVVNGKVHVTFDVNIENKLPGVKFITPTWPVAPAAGVILFPLDYTVTTTPGGVTGGDGNEVIIETPSRGTVTPSIDWNGTGTAGSGAPYSFFNDATCSVTPDSDCFRWEAFETEILPLSGSAAKKVGFDIDASVGQFRVRMIVAADLAAAGTVAPGSISGVVNSPVRGNLSGVTVTASSGQTGTTDAAGAFSLAGVNPGSRTVTLSNLPAGCTAPAPQSVSVTSGNNVVANFTVTCTGQPGTIAGIVTSDVGNAPLPNVTVTASLGGTAVTSTTGAYSIASAPSGAGTLAFSGLPAGCVAPATSYTLPSNGSITVNVVVDCPTPVGPGYQYNTTWTNLPGGQVAVDLRIDMRTFNSATITDVTTLGVTGDPLTGAQLSFTYDATKLTFVEGLGTGSPQITAAPTVNGSVAGTVSVLNGGTALVTGNVGIVRVVFQRTAAATAGTSVGTTTTLTAASSRTGGATVNILANVVNTEAAFVLPAPLP